MIAAASGEVVPTTQLAVDQTRMFRAGRLRPPAVLSVPTLNVEAIDPIPSIAEYSPDFPMAAADVWDFIPMGAPAEVNEIMNMVLDDGVTGSDALTAVAAERGAVLAPSDGEEALGRAMPVLIAKARARVIRGKPVVIPSEIGTDCPDM